MVKISQLPALLAANSGDPVPIVSGGVTHKVDPSIILADWRNLAVVPTVATRNAQKETILQYTGVDYTSILSAGMKIRAPRTTTVPTQCTDLERSSTQYATRASASLNGITFNDDFTIEAWIKVEAYPGSTMAILSRYNGTSGWELVLNFAGQLRMRAYNAGSSNWKTITTYQSVPVGKWVHVAASMDMSSFTATNNKAFINGVDVPASLTTSGTNPTSLVQAGDLQLGAQNSGTNTFDGMISEVRLWSVVRTQQNIIDSMGVSASGSETNLIGCWPLNGNFEDSDPNSNDLTASGSATATSTNNPFRANEFGVITAIQYTGGSTYLTLFTGPCAIPNETLGTTSYSTQAVPYGFPRSENDWCVEWHDLIDMATSSGAFGTYNPNGMKMAIPVGAWVITEQLLLVLTGVTSGIVINYFRFGEAATTSPIDDSEVNLYAQDNATFNYEDWTSKTFGYSTDTQRFIYGQVQLDGSSSVTVGGWRGDESKTVIRAKLAYL